MNRKKSHNKNLKFFIASLFLVGSLLGLLLNDDKYLFAFQEEEIIASIPIGVNDDNVKAILTKDGTLTLSGEGDIRNFTADTTPLLEYQSQISQVVIEDGITSIGDYLFYNCEGLDDTLEIPATVIHIGNGAFYGSDERNAPHFMKIINYFKSADISVNVEKKDIDNEGNEPTNEEDKGIAIDPVMEVKTITEQQMGSNVFFSILHGGFECEDSNASFIQVMNDAGYQKAERFVTVKLDDVLTRNLPVFDSSVFVPLQPVTGLTNPSMDDALHESKFIG